MGCGYWEGGTVVGADSVSCLACSLIVFMGVMVVCWEEGVVMGKEERVECVNDCLREDVGRREWGVVGGKVVLGEESEPGFEGCVRSRIGQGEEVCLSGGSKDVVVE